jgi:hypothetical protein
MWARSGRWRAHPQRSVGMVSPNGEDESRARSRAQSRAAAGLRELVRRLRRAHVTEVAIERSDGLVVDALLDAGLTVVVIAPN